MEGWPSDFTAQFLVLCHFLMVEKERMNLPDEQEASRSLTDGVCGDHAGGLALYEPAQLGGGD
jgi:hypothetical protein